MDTNKKILQGMMGCLIIGWLAASTAWADSCSQADKIYTQSLSQTDLSEKARLLKQTTDLCPSHAEAWNDFGYIREQQGHIHEAEKHYKRAIQIKPSLTVAYAGLGDIQNTQQNYEQAIVNYQTFLRKLAEETQRGDPNGLTKYRMEYQQKLARVMAKLGGKETVFADEITRSLSGDRSNTRGQQGESRAIHPRYKDKAAIDIRILFDFGSDKINTASRGQLEQLSQALRSPGLDKNRIMLIGHTDTIGSEHANLMLSRRRAEGVKWALVAKGIPASRLMTEGRGMTEPVESNATDYGRAKNRRVTVVNVGM